MMLNHATRIGVCTLLAVLGFAVSGRAEDGPRTLAGLKTEHEATSSAIRTRWDGAKTDAERKAIEDEIWKETRTAADRAFSWAETHRDDPESIDAIVWTVHGLANGYYSEYDAEIKRAYKLLTERALSSEKVVPVCYYSAGPGFACPEAKRFLETALEKSPSRLVRGAACLGLARSYHALGVNIRLMKDSISCKRIVEWKGTDFVTRFEGGDPEESDRRAETYFRRVIDEFGDLKMPSPYNQTPFAELCGGELYEQTHLGIGKTMPAIEGEEVGGRKLRLGDYRGKVVAVVFWASWCGPCMGMVPHERELVKRMKDRPFVLLGVNGDDDRAKAAELMTKEAMTWPSLWNGGNTGRIVDQLGVRAWPTIYVIDAKGVIRYKGLRGEALDGAVDRLVSEVEVVGK